MRFDAVVIGAGPAGSTAALSLARAGWSVALVEKAVFPRRKVCGEFVSAASVGVIDALGLGAAWRDRAGPEVRRLALVSGEAVVPAPMPSAGTAGFGRALGRDVLDGILAAAAARAGACLLQPCRVVDVSPAGPLRTVRLSGPEGERDIQTPVVVAAHGSWEPGPLPTQLAKRHRPDDILGFKAHFRGARLDADLMPLLFFPGGYGGMVFSDAGRLSLSLCIRRDALAAARERHGVSSASEAAFRHLLTTSRGVREALGGASAEGSWLAAGPIQPGIRRGYAEGIFRVGNVAGESHPIIAEGISMAIQSASLLAAELSRTSPGDAAGLAQAGRAYEAAWRRQFGTRIRAASLFAAIAMRPRVAALAERVAAAVPGVLTLGALLSGKTRPLPSESL